MKNFYISFRMVDHFCDDAGYTMPSEITIVEANDKERAVFLFCIDMLGEAFQIVDVTEV